MTLSHWFHASKLTDGQAISIVKTPPESREKGNDIMVNFARLPLKKQIFNLGFKTFVIACLSITLIGWTSVTMAQDTPPSSIVEPTEDALPTAETPPETAPTPTPEVKPEPKPEPKAEEKKPAKAAKRKSKSKKSSEKKSRIRPGTKYLFVTFDIGPAFLITEDKTGLKISQEFGYHISGTGEGLALGVSIQEAFAANFIHVALGAKAWYDIPMIEDVGFYLTPSVRMGYGFDRATEFVDKGVDYFNLQINVEARLILDDLWLLYVRPIALDINIGKEFTMSYDAVLGFGYTF
jgi:hypothetical protein